MQEMGKKNLGRDDLHSKNTDQLRKNNLLCANHFKLSQFMNPTLKNKLIHCAVQQTKENNTKVNRPHPKKRSIQVPSTSAYVKIAPTNYGEPSMSSKKTPTTKPSQLSPKIQFLNVLVI